MGVSPRVRRRAWTLYLLMAILAIVLGVVMFLLAGGLHSMPVLPYSLFIPASGPQVAPTLLA